VFLRDPALPIDAAFRQLHQQNIKSVQDLVAARHSVDNHVKTFIQKANDYATKYTNSKRRPLTLQPGSLVMLNTQHLPLPPGLSKKLAPKWLGPLPVLSSVGPVAYKVELPPKLQNLHPVFHVSLLKPF
jgi:hypothetical protein